MKLYKKKLEVQTKVEVDAEEKKIEISYLNAYIMKFSRRNAVMSLYHVLIKMSVKNIIISYDREYLCDK